MDIKDLNVRPMTKNVFGCRGIRSTEDIVKNGMNPVNCAGKVVWQEIAVALASLIDSSCAEEEHF